MLTRPSGTENEQFLLMTTDGLWQAVARRPSKRHRVEQAFAGVNSAVAARKVLAALLARWQLSDNVSLTIVELHL